MGLFQTPPQTPAEIEASAPLDIPPESVVELDEAEWYARAYRRDAPQLTVRAVATGSVVGFFLAVGNVYIGLKTGIFIGVSLTACIVSFAIWTTLRKVGLAKTEMTILENNCAQSTASSAGYATGNAVVSTIPALLLLSVTEGTPYGRNLAWPLLAGWVFLLAALGVVMAIPMKRTMINHEKLKFPTGTAAAVMLQSLHARSKEALLKARALFVGAGVSALIPLLKDLQIKVVGTDPKTGHALRDAVMPGQSNVFDWLSAVLPASWLARATHAAGKTWKLSDYQMKLDHSFALAFAGILVGIRITAWMVFGGLVLVFVIAPPALEAPWENAAGKIVAAAAKPGAAWKSIGLWFGAPMLVASGLVAFVGRWRTIAAAVSSVTRSAKRSSGATDGVDPADVEVPARWFHVGVLVAGGALTILARVAFDIPLHLGALAVVMTFALTLVVCRATGESDITPAGPVGKIVQLTYGVVMPQSITANLMTASITSNASIAASDLLNDLKSGYLLGANPRRQFIAQAMGILTGTVATVLAYLILVPDTTVLTGTDLRPPTFAAPAAQQWKAVAEVFKYGLGNLHPMARGAIRWGAGIGAVLAVAELVAPKRHKEWVPSPIGIGFGLMLPFFVPFTMFLGALFGTIVTRLKPKWAERYLLPLAAGGIAGESVMGVLVQAINTFVLG